MLRSRPEEVHWFPPELVIERVALLIRSLHLNHMHLLERAEHLFELVLLLFGTGAFLGFSAFLGNRRRGRLTWDVGGRLVWDVGGFF